MILRKVRAVLGSLSMAVVLLILIALVLAWGTFYEVRFGTASVQRFVYRSWWFQLLLAFLAVNLGVAALERFPWQRKHVPFVLAHIGIILILVGGILGGLWGIEGQMIIPEGSAEPFLQLNRNVLVVHPLNPGGVFLLPTRFETQAWIREPRTTFQVPFKDRSIQLIVDRYFPNAQVGEDVADQGGVENPAVHLVLSRQEQLQQAWLFARDREQFAGQWGPAHILFLEARTKEQLHQFLQPAKKEGKDRGILSIEFPDLKIRREIPVPVNFDKPIPVRGTPYRVRFKQYFTDFSITKQGPTNRSSSPNNPAIAFTLTGPEGTEPFLAFAFYPDFSVTHGSHPKIHAHATYSHPTQSILPPHAVCLVRDSSQRLTWILTGPSGERREEEFRLNKRIHHPWLDLEFWVDAYYPMAKKIQTFSNRGDEVRQEALHLVARDGNSNASESWLLKGTPVTLLLGGEEILLEYRKATWKLPVTIKLLDFRKSFYPETQMPSGFESDVELTDPDRGLVLKRKITMNNPLKYRGYSFFQSAYLEGPPEATVLSVRKDPGTPLVYAGCLIVIAGVVSMFIFRREKTG